MDPADGDRHRPPAVLGLGALPIAAGAQGSQSGQGEQQRAKRQA